VWSGLVLEGCFPVFGLGLRSLPPRLSLTRVNGPAPCVLSLLGWLVLFMRAALAGKKLTKRLYKLIAASAKGRTLRRGIKEVVKAVRKNQTGYVGRLAVQLVWTVTVMSWCRSLLGARLAESDALTAVAPRVPVLHI